MSTVVVVTPAELERLIGSAVEKALAGQREQPTAALLDRNALARALGVSPSSVARLRRDGMPCVMIGDAPRFELDACLAWLRMRPA